MTESMFFKRVYDVAWPGLRAPGLQDERLSPCSPLLPGPRGCCPWAPHPGHASVSHPPSSDGRGRLAEPLPEWRLAPVLFGARPVRSFQSSLCPRRGQCRRGAWELPLRSSDSAEGRPASRVNVACRCVSRLSTRAPAALTSSPAFLPSPPEQSPSKWYWKLVPVSELRACAQLPSRRPSRHNHLPPLQTARDRLSECPPWWCCCISRGAVMARFWAE